MEYVTRLLNNPSIEASTVFAMRSRLVDSARDASRRMPARSIASAKTVCGSSPETNVLAQTIMRDEAGGDADGAIGPELSQPPRRRGHDQVDRHNAGNPASATPRISPCASDGCRGSSATSAPSPTEGSGLHADAGRRHVVVGHEEVRHQRHGLVDPVRLEIAHAAVIQHLVVDAELSGEFARRFCEDHMGRVAHDFRACGSCASWRRRRGDCRPRRSRSWCAATAR